MKTSKRFLIPVFVLMFIGILFFQNCGSDPGPGGLSVGAKKRSGSSSAIVSTHPLSNQPDADVPAIGATPFPSPMWIPVDQGGGSGGNGTTISFNPPAVIPQLPYDWGTWGVTSDYRNSLPGGPITRYTITLFWVERPSGSGNLVSVPLINGCYQVKVNDRILVDSTQKNASNSECQWNSAPIWFSSNDSNFWSVAKDDQPFLMRFKPRVLNQDVYFRAQIDGVMSNTFCLTTK